MMLHVVGKVPEGLGSGALPVLVELALQPCLLAILQKFHIP